jgi:hypothetical protein
MYPRVDLDGLGTRAVQLGVGGGFGLTSSLDPNTLVPESYITFELPHYNSAKNLFTNPFPDELVSDGQKIVAVQQQSLSGVGSPAQFTIGNQPIAKANILGGGTLWVGHFTAVSEKMQLSSSIPAAVFNAGFSHTFACKPHLGGANLTILGQTDGSESGCYTIRFTTTGEIEILKSSVLSLVTSSGLGTVSDAWAVFTVVYNGTNVKFYRNAELKDTQLLTTTWLASGTGYVQDGGSNLFNGQLAIDFIHTQQLNQTQITGIYNWLVSKFQFP